MTLDSPTLDDSEFLARVENLRKRIPVHTDAWTDHNAHDPGITLLEMFAWLAETYGYQLDQITDRHRRAYLQLLGERPSAPVSATAHLSVELPAAGANRANAVGTTIEAGTSLVADDGTGTPKGFETTESLVLTGAVVTRLVSTYRDGRSDNTAANDTDTLSFQAFGPEAEPGSAMHLGFEVDPFADGADVLDLAVTFAEGGVPQPADHGSEASTFEPSVRVVWQYLTEKDIWFDDEAWLPLPVLVDTTNHFHASGRVRLGQPEQESGGDPSPDTDPWTTWRETTQTAVGIQTPLFWLRATVEAVPLESARTESTSHPCGPDGRPLEPSPEPPATDPTRLRYDLPPQLERVRVNVLEARHQTTRAAPDGLDSLRGTDGSETTTARPNQRFAFPESPVLKAELGLRPHESSDAIDVWTPVEHLGVADADDRVYVLDEATGVVRFGDNLLGSVPPAGRDVVPTSVVVGGGVAGNVPASTRWTFLDIGDLNTDDDSLGTDDRITLSPLGSATGGRDAESVADAFLRVRQELRTPYRCVSLEDYRQVALRTPGLRFGRTAALVEPAPTTEGCAEHGRIHVVAVPFSTVDRPEPSQGFLDAVERHVCEHALLTDRVVVDPPLYVGVGVTAEIRLHPNASQDDVVETVREALDDFFDPLTGYDGTGWPFGRTVYRSEVYELVDGLSGVDCAVDIDLVAAGDGGRVDAQGEVTLDPAALVYPLTHEVLVRTDRDTCGDGYGEVK